MSARTNTFSLWRRNRAAVIGLVIICIALLVCIFGYFIAPDGTPGTDLETVEIQSMPPGYSQQFLRVPLSNFARTNLFAQLLHGSPAAFRYIPIAGFHAIGDTLIVNKFIDRDTSVIQRFSFSVLGDARNYIVTKKYLLGTDALGRDILSRLIIGTRVSMAVGLIAMLVSLTIGLGAGAIAGYYGGTADRIIMWLVNVAWSIPTLLLVFAFTLALGKGLLQVFLAVGLTLWVSVARLVRGQVLGVKELEYVQAAKALGFSDRRIILLHILPNISGPILVIAAGNFATAIIIEAGLSFLGIGVQPPAPSWGLMIRENYNLIITHHALAALIPGFAIMLLVLAFNLLGSGMRDLLAADGR